MSDARMEGYDAQYFRHMGWWRDETLPGWLDRITPENADRTAILTLDGAITYRQLRDRVYKAAAGLRALGIGRGDVVAVHLPNLPEFLVAWLAINARGAAMQTVHLPYGTREIEHLLRHSGATAIIARDAAKDRSPAGELLALRGDVKSLQTVIAVGRPVAGTEDFAGLEADAAGRGPAANDAMADEPFLVSPLPVRLRRRRSFRSASITFSAMPGWRRRSSH